MPVENIFAPTPFSDLNILACIKIGDTKSLEYHLSKLSPQGLDNLREHCRNLEYEILKYKQKTSGINLSEMDRLERIERERFDKDAKERSLKRKREANEGVTVSAESVMHHPV